MLQKLHKLLNLCQQITSISFHIQNFSENAELCHTTITWFPVNQTIELLRDAFIKPYFDLSLPLNVSIFSNGIRNTPCESKAVLKWAYQEFPKKLWRKQCFLKLSKTHTGGISQSSSWLGRSLSSILILLPPLLDVGLYLLLLLPPTSSET